MGYRMLIMYTGNRAVVQVFEGTTGIDVKKVGFSMKEKSTPQA
jgi:vacuolar-type H+-ATPase subunit B/Vma2